MKVLVITQKVDEEDALLGFFCSWLNKLAKQIDRIYVLASEKGKVDLAENIELYSLGKERNRSKIKRFLKFNQILVRLLLGKKVDIVFVHMCPEYAILCAPYAKFIDTPIVMWYAHRNVNTYLRLAHFLVDKIVTSSEDGFMIESNKLTITGQGIDIDKFKPQTSLPKSQNKKKVILSVGRISPIKDYETLIKTADILINKKGIKDIEFNIIGGIHTEWDIKYYEKLKDMVFEFCLVESVRFRGPVHYGQIANYYQNCDMFINLSSTGAPDKVVFEAMTCGKIPLVCNKTFAAIFDGCGKEFIFKEKDASDLSNKILACLEMEEDKRRKASSHLRQIGLENHNLDILTDRLVNIFKQVINETPKSS